ncbi:MAG TPA: hypothetical protein VLG47_06610 [Candidatus Saccharimonadales bacterium]|nr:hypothetical protein [Candidatus Saccharimonadales bacterium]
MAYEQYSLDGGHKARRRFGLSKWRVVTVVLLILIGAVLIAHFVTHRSQHVASANASALASQDTSAAVPNPKPDTAAQAAIRSADVSKLVTDFYNQYIAVASKMSSQAARGKIVQQYGTSKLLAYYSPANGSYPVDPIMCVSAVPSKIKVMSVNANTYSADGKISESYSSGPLIVNFTVVKQSGTLKIDSISCNPPLVANPS